MPTIPFDKEFLEYLKKQITSERLSRFNQVIQHRTRYGSVLLENLFQEHNASAVLRTCDALGFQDVHIVENENKWRVNDQISLGSAQWLNLKKAPQSSDGTELLIDRLKKSGHRIVATSPHVDGYELYDFPIEKGKFVMMFGTELKGLSQIALSMADEHVRIPMYGFVESFNISVSAAICLSHISNQLRKSKLEWQLSNHEQDVLLQEWILASVKQASKHLDYFKQLPKPSPD